MVKGIKASIDELIAKYQGSVSDSYLNVAHVLKGDKVEGTSYRSWAKRIPKILEGFDALAGTQATDEHKEFASALYSIFADYSTNGYLAKKIKSSDAGKKHSLEQSVNSVCGKALGYLTLTYGGSDYDQSFSGYSNAPVTSAPDSREKLCSALSESELKTVYQISGSAVVRPSDAVNRRGAVGRVLPNSRNRTAELKAEEENMPIYAGVGASVKNDAKEESYPDDLNGGLPDEHRLEESLSSPEPSEPGIVSSEGPAESPKTEVDKRLEAILNEAEETSSDEKTGVFDEGTKDKPSEAEPRYDDGDGPTDYDRTQGDKPAPSMNERIVASLFEKANPDFSNDNAAARDGYVSKVKGYLSGFGRRLRGLYSGYHNHAVKDASDADVSDADASDSDADGTIQSDIQGESSEPEYGLESRVDQPDVTQPAASHAPSTGTKSAGTDYSQKAESDNCAESKPAQAIGKSLFSKIRSKVISAVRKESSQEAKLSYLKDSQSVGYRYNIDKQAYDGLFGVLWSYDINPFFIPTQSNDESNKTVNLASLLSMKDEQQIYDLLGKTEDRIGPDKVIRHFLNQRSYALESSSAVDSLPWVSQYKSVVMASAVVLGILGAAAIGNGLLNVRQAAREASDAAAISAMVGSSRRPVTASKEGAIVPGDYTAIPAVITTCMPTYITPSELDDMVSPTPLPVILSEKSPTPYETAVPATALPFAQDVIQATHTSTPVAPTATSIKPTATPTAPDVTPTATATPIDLSSAFDKRDMSAVASQRMLLEDELYKTFKPMLEKGKDPAAYTPSVPNGSLLTEKEVEYAKNEMIESAKRTVFTTQGVQVKDAYYINARLAIHEGKSLDEVRACAIETEKIFPDGTLLPEEKYQAARNEGISKAISTEQQIDTKMVTEAYQKAADKAISQGKSVDEINSLELKVQDINERETTCLDDFEFSNARLDGIRSSINAELKHEEDAVYDAYARQAGAAIANNQNIGDIKIAPETIFDSPILLTPEKIEDVREKALHDAAYVQNQNAGSKLKPKDESSVSKAQQAEQSVEDLALTESSVISESLRRGWHKKSQEEIESAVKQPTPSAEDEVIIEPTPSNKRNVSAEDKVAVLESQIPPPNALFESLISDQSVQSVAPLAAEQAAEDVVVDNAISLADRLNDMHQKGEVKLRFNKTMDDDLEMWRGISKASFSVEGDTLKGQVSTHVKRGDMAVRILVDGKRTYVEPNAEFEIPLGGNTKIQYQLGEFKDNTFVVGSSGVWSSLQSKQF